MGKQEIPDIVIQRLPVYLQALNQLLREGRGVVSSAELGHIVDVSAAQIRKNLSFFGGFGKQGSGYNVISLIHNLRAILNLNQIWPVVIVGVGNLGQALLKYQGFSRKGFEIVLACDNNPELIGTSISGIEISDVRNLAADIQRLNIQMAILTVPAGCAQTVTDLLVNYGIKAILNYAPLVLKVPEGVHVINIDPVVKLQTLTYYLNAED
ncbi:MAG: redox-sensing transcriptional repressor Rex [Anaerolineaceae bacterium]|jgi:redox-sensing transcriptional repressor|nr:redox-sensing transcriptional repressor Rex [Anaerolineaceae bacterium]